MIFKITSLSQLAYTLEMILYMQLYKEIELEALMELTSFALRD